MRTLHFIPSDLIICLSFDKRSSRPRVNKVPLALSPPTSPTEHYATISMTFVDRSSETELKVECRGVPESEEERTKEGWKRYYFEAIKQTFGYGARLY